MDLRRWIQDHPRPLEWAYRLTDLLFQTLDPLFAWLGYKRAERFILPLERVGKEALFDCGMCGQCILSRTGMTCPMTCPKRMRNGPCGGVRLNSHCEVYPERYCVWADAYKRSLKMSIYGRRILDVQPIVDWQLRGTSAWINKLTGADQPRERCPYKMNERE
jgi:hypothetical protein